MVKRRKASRKKNDYEYIGQFVWNFGTIESYINEIFLELFDLDRLRFMFIGLIDTRKKIALIREGFREQNNLHTTPS